MKSLMHFDLLNMRCEIYCNRNFKNYCQIDLEIHLCIYFIIYWAFVYLHIK